MKKNLILLLALVTLLLAGTASASWAPVDFQGGSPSGIVADGDDLLVSDVFNKIVWRISGNTVEKAVGQISVKGLDGEPIGKYDDGTLSTALFMEPWAMTPFLDGYAITDTEAHVVRYFDNAGVFTAVGSGTAGSKNGTGIGASFDTPTGLATGPDGEVYIADTGNGAIRVMNEKGKVTTLVSDLVEPSGLCWANGALYVAETGRNRILRIEDGRQEVVAGIAGVYSDGHYEGGYTDGPVSAARFDHPQGVAVASDGTIYVADTNNGAVRKISDGRVFTLAASGKSPLAPIQPRGILVQEDKLLVTDLFAQTVLEIDLTPVSYTDVPTGHWCEDYVTAASERGITQGTSATTFSPDQTMTRATFTVMLSRMHLNVDGNAVIDGETTFSDVPEDAWYAGAVRWAADLGIVQGYDGKFDPHQPISRQQLVTMLYRYAVTMGYDVSVGEDTNILSYTDVFGMSEYAFPAMQWACGEGIVGGYADGSLQPHAQATRAHMVKILITAMDAIGI